MSATKSLITLQDGNNSTAVIAASLAPCRETPKNGDVESALVGTGMTPSGPIDQTQGGRYRIKRTFLTHAAASNNKDMGTRIFIAFFITIFCVSCTDQRELTFEQIYSGSNGTESVGAEYYSSLVELDNSWVRGAVGNSAYSMLLTRVDFSKQVIVAFTAGKISSFSGKITITSVYQYTGSKDLPMNIGIKLGILRNECKRNKVSLPFVIAAIERPPQFQPIGGFDVATVADTCSKSN